jgi:DNA uptake protein ComE-like DNA-binding protein
LILVSFLAAQYLAHNRDKAGLAANAWESLKQKQAVESVLHLFATDSWPIPGQQGTDETWIHLSPGGVDLSVRVEKESSRININTANDFEIREKIRKILGEDRQDEADQLADAILDWRDKDTLIRNNGAEAGYYKDQDLPYAPSNGPFKVLTELLLVKGMSPELFWGNPMASILAQEESLDEENLDMESIPSFAENFTIHPKDVKSVTILIPGKGKGYLFVLAFLKKEKGRWNVIEIHRTMLVVV